MKSLFARSIAVVGGAALLGTMAAMSEGCTVITTSGPLDGGPVIDTDAATTSRACNECLFQQCTGVWTVCESSPQCFAIYTCSTADGADVNKCFADHPTGQDAYNALSSCDEYNLTAPACASACGNGT